MGTVSNKQKLFTQTNLFNSATTPTSPIRMADQADDQRPAVERVFGIAEMLEKILLILPEQDLLTNATRVCKKWHDFIIDSPPLQQKLFFEPAPGPARLRLVNPALGEEGSESDRSKSIYHDIQLNPLHCKWWNKPDRQTRSASYRRMLLCQPAVHEYGGVEQKDGIKLTQIPRRYLMSLAGQEIVGVEVEGSLSN